ncbi:Ig-like domain-containing protein [Eubacterium xylanophilum]|uniref:Ig-like domain-containing protein n=1 Tax=Eubacterium xylanophilum TaxID=39497 RepID=UPI00047BEF04|nr:Ig-like domain-containing protein [Eubacterium xylanophilum]
MRQNKQTFQSLKKVLAFMLVFAMAVSTLAVSSNSDAASKKVKKVTIGAKKGVGVLVLKKGQSKKLNVSVSPKSANKKVTYKSSNKKVIKVSKKGVVKAVKASGSAKITVTSKSNKKKKATITVKAGKPITKIGIKSSAKVNWSSANPVITTNPKTGQKTKTYPSFSATTKKTKGAFTFMAGRTLTVKTNITPSKATYKSLKWKANKSALRVISFGSYAKLTIDKKYGGKSYKVTVSAKDGSGKKATFKVNITKFVTDKTPAPTAAPLTGKATVVEDFESYKVGQAWGRYTAGGYSKSGHMTVVTDPENAKNKVLQIKYDGEEQAFDYAPVFDVDLSKLKDQEGASTASKTLGSYSGVRLDARVVGTGGSYTRYKRIYCYFDKAGNIKSTDYFAANDNKSGSAHVDKDGKKVAKGAANEEKRLRFGIENSMATGTKDEYGIKLWNGTESKESTYYFPFAYESNWSDDDVNKQFGKDSCTSGFKLKDGQTIGGKAVNVGFATRSLSIDQGVIKEYDDTLVNDKKFDVVIGSTYDGLPSYKATGVNVTLYIDNVRLIEEDIPVKAIKIDGDLAEVNPGTANTLKVAYTPANTSQKEIAWSVTTDAANKDKVTIDASGELKIAEDFVFGEGNADKEITVTATSKANNKLVSSKKIVVKYVAPADSDLILDPLGMRANDKVDTEGVVIEAAKDAEGNDCVEYKFTKNNQSTFIELPQSINLNLYDAVEVKAYAPAQMTLELFPEELAAKMAEGVDWWDADVFGASAQTYPFYLGSHALRPDHDVYDQAEVAKWEAAGCTDIKEDDKGVKYIPKGTALGDISTETGVFKVADIVKAGKDITKIKYLRLGTNKIPTGIYDEEKDEDDWTKVHYYIYSIKFVAKKGNDAASGSAVSGSSVQ